MNPKETAKSYDELAAHWNGEHFNRKNGILQHQRALRFAKSKALAIDIGCGSSGRIIDLLIAEGFDVEGLDISPRMIELARKRHPEQTFYRSDICDWVFPRKYDFISAWDSIWHAPLGSHEAILLKLCAALNEDGILIFTSGGLDRPDAGCNSFMGTPLYHAALGIPQLLKIIDSAGCICRHLEYDQYPELHIYLIVQKAERGGAGNVGRGDLACTGKPHPV
ncbi:MAG: class I SAM-dependent methyltransferase [Phycisphaeraceae bacterium]|nr:class I SAM-dependent methyltransferase [Phycisphaeraceae bacterium]